MPEYVEATAIDPPSLLSGAEKWLAAASETVAEKCGQYKLPSKIETETEYRDAKASRAQCRRDFAELDAERKAMTRKLEDALKGFRSEVKDVLSPLTDIDERYKALIDSYESEWKVRRHILLSQEYAELAPDLVALVPFGRILSKFGEERGRAWLNRSTNVVVAKEGIADAIETIAEGEATIDRLVSDEDRAEVKRMYFDTLDLQAALKAADDARKRRRMVEELERQRQQRIEEACETAATDVARQEPEAAPEQPSLDMEPEQPMVPEGHPWVISVPCATRAEMERLAQLMRDSGIEFDRIYSGTIADVYAKWSVRNA